MRLNRAIEFPYKIREGTASPIIPIKIGRLAVDAYVDSGAFVSIFSVQDANFLGIDYQKGQKSLMKVGDGNLIPVFLHTLPIQIGHISFNATIGFSTRLGIGFNLLGRKDIFNRFVVIFDDAKKKVNFLPNRHR